MLNLSPDELLTTTRSVRLRLDLTQPVSRTLIEECLEVAQQAPSGGNQQTWSFLVVTDPEKRQALGALYKQGWEAYIQVVAARRAQEEPAFPRREVMRVYRSAQYLADHMGEVPVLVVPCITGRPENTRDRRASRASGARSCPPPGVSCSPPAPVVSAPAGRRSTCSTNGKRPISSAFPTIR